MEIKEAKFTDKGIFDNQLVIKDNFGLVEIDFRNVGNKNPDAQLQFSIKEYPRGKRTKYTSFSIPASCVDEFIKRLSEVKQ